MDKLTQKYRFDTLTPDELQKLKEKVNKMSNNELETVIYNDWENADLQTDNIDTLQITHMKNNINSRINSRRPVRLVMLKVVQIAAVILLPIFIISTFYLYKENNQMLSSEMIVATGKGERANIVLPDGTEVALNYESQIVYTPKLYNKQERKIRFDGEGFFKISKDRKHPFIIHAKGLQVNVLGTTFNLSARNNDTMAELTLEEGSVRLVSIMTGKNVLLAPNQKATLNYATGNITITNNSENSKVAPWRKGDLIFRNEKLKIVLKALENNYNCQIKIDCENCLEDIFTGTLSISDINEALEVLEKSYHFKTSIKGKEILLYKER